MQAGWQEILDLDGKCYVPGLWEQEFLLLGM